MAARSTPPPPPRTDERRSFARVPFRGDAVLTTERGDVTAGVVDVSMGGVSLCVRGTVPWGAFVRVRLPHLDLEPHAVVVRVQPTTDPEHTMLGLSFLGLPPAAVGRLRSLAG